MTLPNFARTIKKIASKKEAILKDTIYQQIRSTISQLKHGLFVLNL